MAYGLIFDVDGVIADTEPISCRACSAAFYELHGVTVPIEDHLDYMGATSQKHARGIAAKYSVRGDIDELIAAFQSIFLEELSTAKDIAFPGIHALVDRVASYDDWSLGLATSSDRQRSAATIESAAFKSELLRAWTTADDITKPKPDPEIYMKTASTLGLFPKQCVVIEDSIAGITAAKAASMHCIAVTNTFPGEALREADRIVDSIKDVDVTMLYDLVDEGRA